ncbi:MAG: hypothetical protein WBX15_01270 [Thermoanaerobaculia bacterium]
MTRIAIGLVVVVLTAVSGAMGQVVEVAPSGAIVVAHDGVIEMYDGSGHRRLWQVEGVRHPGAIAIGEKRIAVLDPLNDAIRVVGLDGGNAATLASRGSPVAAEWSGDALMVLDRDAGTLTRIEADGARASIATGIYPDSMRKMDGKIYVYSRGDGLFQEISTKPLRVERSMRIEPFASDLEVDQHFAYFVYPTKRRIRSLELKTFLEGDQSKVAGVPADLDAGTRGTLMTARLLSIADAAGKRVLRIEVPQSTGAAFGRGFLRGLLGLGLFNGSAVEFPSAVDRVASRGRLVLAYDSLRGTLWSVVGRTVTPIATGISPRAFAFTREGVVWWDGKLMGGKIEE